MSFDQLTKEAKWLIASYPSYTATTIVVMLVNRCCCPRWMAQHAVENALS